MRQAIITKYLGPTNYRSARVKASCEAGSIIVSWNGSMNTQENHIWALSRLCRKLDRGSEKDFVCGWLGDRMVAVEKPQEVKTAVVTIPHNHYSRSTHRGEND